MLYLDHRIMKTRIAIVEDTKGLRTTIGEWLSDSKDLLLVGSCESAEVALRDLPAQKPDVVLMDINLPGADGIECVRKLKPQLPEAQFLMLTVYEDTQKFSPPSRLGRPATCSSAPAGSVCSRRSTR